MREVKSYYLDKKRLLKVAVPVLFAIFVISEANIAFVGALADGSYDSLTRFERLAPVGGIAGIGMLWFAIVPLLRFGPALRIDQSGIYFLELFPSSHLGWANVCSITTQQKVARLTRNSSSEKSILIRYRVGRAIKERWIVPRRYNVALSVLEKDIDSHWRMHKAP